MLCVADAISFTGGGGGGIAEKKHGGLCSITFDAQQLYIPDVCFTTTKVFGVPLPPGNNDLCLLSHFLLKVLTVQLP